MVLNFTISALFVVADMTMAPSGAHSEVVKGILNFNFGNCARMVKELQDESVPALVQLEKLRNAPDTAFAKLGTYQVQVLLEKGAKLLVDPALAHKNAVTYNELVAASHGRPVTTGIHEPGTDLDFPKMPDRQTIDRQRKAVQSLFSILEEQAIRPPLDLDPALRYRHTSDEYRSWVMKFDTMKLQNPEMQRLETAWLDNRPTKVEIKSGEHTWDDLVASQSTSKAGGLTIGVSPELAKMIRARISDLDIVRETHTELYIDRNFWTNAIFHDRLLKIFKRLGLPTHPFNELVVATNPLLAGFFDKGAPATKAYIEKISTDKEARDGNAKDLHRDLGALNPTDKARVLRDHYTNQSRLVKEDDYKLGYIPTEPLVSFSARFLILRLLEDPTTLVIRPDKPSRDGDYIIAAPEYQLRIRLKADGTLDSILLNLQTPNELYYKVPRERSESAPKLIAPTDPNLRAAGPKAVEKHVETTVKIAPKPYQILSIASLGLDPKVETLVRERLESFNQEFPGHNEFIEAAAILISPNGDLVKELRGF